MAYAEVVWCLPEEVYTFCAETLAQYIGAEKAETVLT
jgi:hypothetical protein